MRFALKAVDAANQVIALELEAADMVSARDLARQRGYSVIALAPASIFDLGFFGRRRAFPAMLFSIELLALLDAGLNVVESLQTLAEKEADGENHRVLRAILDSLSRGETLSRAVAAFPQVFSPLYVATLRSSERTGNIKDAIGRYIAYQEELDKIRKKIFTALLYPAILVAVSTLVLGFLMFYVVPRFARVYEEISTGLPLFSRLLLLFGKWVEQNNLLLALALLCAFAAAAYALSRETVRAAILARLWRIPAFGERMRVYQLARFYRTASMLLQAGIPALRAFDMVADLLPVNLRSQLTHAVRMLEEGSPISTALTSTGLTTPVATRMMLVGERSGQMGELMDRIARFYDDDTARFVEAFTRIFEPLLMALLGLAVGGVVVLMYMPIFELAGSIQ